MAPRRSTGSARCAPSTLLPCEDRTWREVAERLALSPQQERIVELILCGKRDKEIALALGLTVPTIRTYLKRIFDRVEVPDRLALVLRVFAMAQQVTQSRSDCDR